MRRLGALYKSTLRRHPPGLPAVLLFILSTSGPAAAQEARHAFPFSRVPTARWELDDDLEEISALTVLDSVAVAAVEDEHGIVYVLDTSSGRVTRRVRFAGRGDYEGIERIGNRLYVLESNGDLFVLHADYRSWGDREDARRIKTPLSGRYDTEGLAFDPASGDLLIACKEYPGKKLGKRRAIYRFDPITEKLDDEPAFLLSADQISPFFDDSSASYGHFKPSALAIHPLTGHLFLVSSRDRVILELNRNGDALSAMRLDEQIAPQPEGIVFLDGGRMLISTEADGRKAALILFRSEE
jgi:uncharacterized protein YjiK